MGFSTGHGIEGRYGGLPDQFSNKDAKIIILPVPFDKTTTYKKGTDQGPFALIEASRNMELYDIETNSEVCLKGIHTLDPIIASTSKDMITKTYKTTLDHLKQNKFVVTLGGEHAISYAPIKAHLETHKDISILQFDAHLDLYDAYEGDKYSHASVMARVKELKGITNIVPVGIRSMGIDEKKHVDNNLTFFAHDIYNTDNWMQQALDKLGSKVYITFDLDVFDSAIMPSTGTPEPGGMNWYQVTKFLKLVCAKKELVGFDVVELCPNPHNHAPDFLAAKLVYKLLSYKFH